MKIIAYYLPQFHPIEENNRWWGEGFTEWTNVGKAKKYFKGHEQPKVPKDLGYYDLRNKDIRLKQAVLAKEAGIDAFCYWHYWFGNGKQLLERPFNEVLCSGQPDFPFCLGWANESWKAKVWDSDASKDKTLIEQQYPGKRDYIEHFNALLPAFIDKRYLKIEDRPVFVIYKPLMFSDCQEFISIWNNLAKNEGFEKGIHFIAYADYSYQIEKMLDLGFNGVNIVRVSEYYYNKNLIRKLFFPIFKYKIFNCPLVIQYSLALKYFIQQEERNQQNIYPTIIPNWDHTPRSGKRGVVFRNSNPKLFAGHINEAFDAVKNKNEENKIIFLKSWNEWGEGNYMEPDLRYGKGYISALRKVKHAFLQGE